VVDQSLDFSFGTLNGTLLSMGNPHFVCWKPDQQLDDLNERVLRVGLEVEKSPHFRQGTNFELASKISDSEINMAVWERGAGYTLACGSGATAAVCAGVKIGSLPADQPIVVNMAGGKLTINVHEKAENIEIEGEATYVFSGDIDFEALSKR
jgi:diaminopimelate epimerase